MHLYVSQHRLCYTGVTNTPKILNDLPQQKSYFLVHASYPTPCGLMWASALYSTLDTQSGRSQTVILSFAEAEEEEEWETIHKLFSSSLLLSIQK